MDRRCCRILSSCFTAIWLLIGCASACGQVHYVDVIDPTVHYQTIEYFTASDCWSMQEVGGWSTENRRKIADLLFSSTAGIGLSGWRFNLGAGIERTRIRNPWRTSDTFEVSRGNYDWTRCPNQRWFLAAARERGVNHFIAFANSPPRRLTVNGLSSVDANADKLTNNLQPGMEHQYGVYLADILKHFRNDPQASERVNFNWVSPVNEPQWDWTGNQEGTRACNEDIVRQYKAISAELLAHNLTTGILGPESGSIQDLYHDDQAASGKHGASYGNYIDLLCTDGLSAPLQNHIAYHSYWSDDEKALVATRQKTREALNRHPSWKAVESEYCVMERGRDLSMQTAIRIMRVMHADLTIVNSVGWSWWLSVSNGDYKDGLIYTDWRKPGDEETVIPSKWFWCYGNVARFVRPGMVRVDLKPTGTAHALSGVFASAYQNPVTGQVVAVYVNSGNQPVTLVLLLHLTKPIWTPYITSDAGGDDLRALPAITGDSPITLPAQSVITLVSAH